MPEPVLIKLRAAPLPAGQLPRPLQGGARRGDVASGDDFLPPGLIGGTAGWDLSPAARATQAGALARTLVAGPDDVLVLELPDGVTVVTHPARLRDALQRIDPQAVDADGALVLDQALRQRGEAVRGPLGDAAAGAPGGERGAGLAGIVSQVHMLTLARGADPILDAARRQLAEWRGDDPAAAGELGVSWLGTRALMAAIEARLGGPAGLYRWSGRTLGAPLGAGDPALAADAAAGPLLVFIHGAGSSTGGSFGALGGAPDEWHRLEARYGERMYAFEHRSLSESPIDNALQLARALPEGATVHLVTHSRGGLVGDLLGLAPFEALVDGYGRDAPQIADADPAERARIVAELALGHAAQRGALQALASELRARRLRVERYVRVASPARGTRLASGNLDVFLSALLTLMGWTPGLRDEPAYAAFRRAVLEIARHRTQPHLVPGLEAMLPGSALSRLLARATPQPGLALGVVSGDVEGGGWLKRLAVLFTDFTFFDGTDNDLLVDTDAMVGGIARPGSTHVLFDHGPEVHHFRYFVNAGTRRAVPDWLTAADVHAVEGFRPLPGAEPAAVAAAQPPDTATAPAAEDAAAADATRAATHAGPRPVVVLLPGIMGSHLARGGRRVWFDLPGLVRGGLADLRLSTPGADDAQAQALFDTVYGDLARHLAGTHRVVPFPYDWRQPLDVLADRLAGVLRELLDATGTPPPPVRVLAHSLGGLLARALAHRHPGLWDALMARDGARLVLLGTPNQGSHAMVEALLGKSDSVRRLGLLDARHGLQGVLDVVAGFPGALQLLPRPGFVDTGGAPAADWYDPAHWAALADAMRDPWFGDRIGARPTAAALERGRWLWSQPAALPAAHAGKVAYVFGCAPKTPCGLVREGERWKLLGTPHGDGSVTWDAGRLEGIGRYFWMPAAHGALASSPAGFEAIQGLLERGDGAGLATRPPERRGGETPPLAYDAGPTPYPTEAELAAGLMGSARAATARTRRHETLRVRVRAMDLRHVTQPILVGHFEQDAISGPEAIIDRELVRGELRLRHHLGLYAGPVGTASAVLIAGNAQERARGSLRGAVVAGLGPYDGSLTLARLTEAIRTAALRYLVHALDSGAAGDGEAPRALALASLLVGYNSSANLAVDDAVEALLRGVAEANRQFAEAAPARARIAALDIVEMYLDTAITATYAVRRLAGTLAADARLACRIEADPELRAGPGVRQRLHDGRGGPYWPRMLITEAPDDPAAGADTGLARRLRFLFLGPRARAESVLQQPQPGLVERLVQRQVASPVVDPDFSRTLFQLLVPHDFQDAARQLQQVVFVLDAATANVPWELMRADDAPLATRTAMVRQLSTPRFRARVSQTLQRRAYVVGNPGTDGGPWGALGPLPGAEQEALAVVRTLAGQGFEVERAVGSGQRALDVVNGLYRYPYRIVHVAGHGLLDEAGGRSGVVLSDGLLVSAAEIDAMEVVPDLVFLNCCHLGEVEREPVAFHRLASGIARQLIEIGVRAVVAAGWAVDDVAAKLFAETFYDRLVAGNQPFGMAVFQARCVTHERHPASTTWGAYQAWGDPGWRVDPRTDAPATRTAPPAGGVAPEELLDKLDTERQALRRAQERPTPAEARRVVERVQGWFAHAPSAWTERPDLQSALGDLLFELGPAHVEAAMQCYARAIASGDPEGKVPIRAIEQLANAEARLGEARGDAALVARGIERLAGLLRVTQPDTARPATEERAALLGGAWKRKAAVHARAWLADGDRAAFEAMREALGESLRAYEAMASGPDAPDVRPYATLNGLFLRALGRVPGARATRGNGGAAPGDERATWVRHAERCAAAARAAFGDAPTAWNATMVGDAALVAALLGDALGTAPQAAVVLETLVRTYEDALEATLATPRERDSIVQQVRLMALFHRAYERAQRAAGAADDAVSAVLERLARRLGGRDADASAASPPAAPSSASASASKRPRRSNGQDAAAARPATTPAPAKKAGRRSAGAVAPRRKAGGRAGST